MPSPRSGDAGPPGRRIRPRVAARSRRSRRRAWSSLNPRWKSRAILRSLYERSAAGIRIPNAAFTSGYQNCEPSRRHGSKDQLRTKVLGRARGARDPRWGMKRDELPRRVLHCGHVERERRDHGGKALLRPRRADEADRADVIARCARCGLCAQRGLRGEQTPRLQDRSSRREVKKGGQLFIKKAASHRSVSPDEKLSVQVWKLFLRFRKTVWFRVTYLVLLGLIVPNLLPFSAGGLGCLVIILVPLAVFLVPYYLGERSVKRFA